MSVSKAGFGQNVHVNIERGREVKNGFAPKGFFNVEIWRDGKLHHKELVPNGVTNIGKDTILDSFFRNQAPPTTWYLGFIDDPATLAATDTMAAHAGWTESTGYSEGTRPAWATVAAASQSITNSTPATFSINGTDTLHGVFAVDENTKGGATGTLWATAAFASPIPVINGDILKITYTVNAT
jgi:hypothetical protein